MEARTVMTDVGEAACRHQTSVAGSDSLRRLSHGTEQFLHR